MILINVFASHVDAARAGTGLVNVGRLKNLGFHGMTACLLTPLELKTKVVFLLERQVYTSTFFFQMKNETLHLKDNLGRD